MNCCEERHESKYQIKYKSAKGGNYSPVWLVCEECKENKNHFGSKDLIESISILA
jgi:hypothetical protein